MAREQPVVARDFLGIGSMGDITKRNDVVGKQSSSHCADRSMSLNASPFLNHMAIAGMKHSVWSKAATMQHFLLPRGSFEEKFKEQSAENLPERSVPQFVHSLQMQDLATNNQKNGSHTQAWWQGDSFVNGSAQSREDCGPSVPGFWGLTNRTMISPSKPEAVVSSARASSEMRMPSSGNTDMPHNALTIFYAGNVIVFNNISAEKAQEIMFLASGGNVQGSPVEPTTATPVVRSMNGTTAHEKPPIILHSSQTVASQQAKANQVTTNMKLDFTHLNIPGPSSPISGGQPVVPTALPHARKASLTRFFEKRRERVNSKSPYYMEREDSSLPEERFSSSNDATSYAPGGEHPNRKKGPIPNWMQEVAECSTSDMGVGEQKTTAT
eukprot:c18843_g1_i1 orf=207-1355(+)